MNNNEKIDSLEELVIKTSIHHDFNLMGNVYQDLPENVWDHCADTIEYYGTKKAMEQGSFALFGEPYSEMFQDSDFNEESGEHYDICRPELNYRFETKDGGVLYYNFSGKYDSVGNADITTDSKQAAKALILIESIPNIDELFRRFNFRRKS